MLSFLQVIYLFSNARKVSRLLLSPFKIITYKYYFYCMNCLIISTFNYKKINSQVVIKLTRPKLNTSPPKLPTIRNRVQLYTLKKYYTLLKKQESPQFCELSCSIDENKQFYSSYPSSPEASISVIAANGSRSASVNSMLSSSISTGEAMPSSADLRSA